ncbi:MAG: hypothetical protein FD129_2630, partial [bacterium]
PLNLVLLTRLFHGCSPETPTGSAANGTRPGPRRPTVTIPLFERAPPPTSSRHPPPPGAAYKGMILGLASLVPTTPPGRRWSDQSGSFKKSQEFAFGLSSK